MDELLRIAICEDMPEDADRLRGFAEKSGKASLCAVFESGEDFLASFSAGMYDLIFMDIYMKGMRGVETAEAIRETDRNVVIAFTTSSRGHTDESYRLKALMYLDKPVREYEVNDALELALMKKKNRRFITVSMAGGTQKEIYLDTIIYLEHQNHAVQLNTTEGVLMSSSLTTLDGLEPLLPSPPFLRCHRSFFVNMDYVQGADQETNSFRMKNGGRADIKRGLYTKCKTQWQEWIMYKTGSAADDRPR